MESYSDDLDFPAKFAFLSSLTGSVELSQSGHLALCHISYWSPSSLIAQSGWVATSRCSPGFFKLLPFEASLLLVFFSPVVFWALTQSCLWALQDASSTWFFRLNTSSAVRLYIDLCLLFQIVCNCLNPHASVIDILLTKMPKIIVFTLLC